MRVGKQIILTVGSAIGGEKTITGGKISTSGSGGKGIIFKRAELSRAVGTRQEGNPAFDFNPNILRIAIGRRVHCPM